MEKGSLEKEFKGLLALVESYNPQANISQIKQAWKFSKIAHVGQKRLSGEDFVFHPLRVSQKLAGWELDTTSIIAGLLHDTVEDGGATRKDIVKGFGEEVAQLVDGVTKVTNIRLKGSREEEFIENLRKMLLVMAKDLRVILVKLADRLHNLETLSALPLEKQKENGQETLDIYAPLAERLGIGEAKTQLEDLAFPYVYPEHYRRLQFIAKPHYKKAAEDMKKMKRVLLQKLIEEKIKAKISGRKKGLYSLWGKLERKEINQDFNKINDIVALRILVNKISQCYTTLGIVHGAYKPVPHIGISDFIAQPKPNGYRSIHTKVFGPRGRIVEIQIRTHKMHKQAEFGVASHWVYAAVKLKGAKDEQLEKGRIKMDKEKLSWVKELVRWQEEMTDPKEFLRAVKFDALRHRNFIFSPKGDVFDLPFGATPVDFAFAVHTDLGKWVKGAKVDGKMVPLDFQLESGQVVEIIKTKNPRKANSDWLKFVVTTTARQEINKYLRKEEGKG